MPSLQTKRKKKKKSGENVKWVVNIFTQLRKELKEAALQT
jgi:hypothetical protein